MSSLGYHLQRIEWGIVILTAIISIIAGIINLTVSPSTTAFYLNDPTFWAKEKENTLEMWEVIIYSIICFFALVFTEWGTPHERTNRQTQACIIFRLSLMYLVTLLLTASTTEILKVMVGGLRPCFARVCFGDAAIPPPSYSSLAIYNNDQCTEASDDRLDKFRKSFPSGHTSFAFAASIYLTLYLFWKGTVLRDTGGMREGRVEGGVGGGGLLGQVVSMCGVVPLWCAWLVGASRIMDNRHFVGDVVGGALLGGLFAGICFWFVVSNLRKDYF